MISPVVILLLTTTNAGCVSHTPRTVKFSSKNLMTFLTWEPAAGSSSETLYQVQYKKYTDSGWIQKKECWNISLVHCDLTKNIIDVKHWICGRVRAISHSNESDWVPAKMSLPDTDMTIDPPGFHLVPETNSIKIHIHPSFENYTDVEKIEYMINFKQRNSFVSTKKTTLHTEKIEKLTPGTEYCVSVSSKIWLKHNKYTNHNFQSAWSESCAFTETDQSHLQLIMHLSVGLLMLLLLIFALILLIWGFKSIYRPPAAMPLNLIFTVEQWKTLQRKAYVDIKQYDDDSMDRNTRNWVQSKAKTNLYIKIPQRELLSEQPIVNSSDEPLMGFSTPPPLLEGVHHIQGYAPQLSFPATQIDQSYGVVHHGLGITAAHDLSSSDSRPDSMVDPSPRPIYINSEHPERVYTNSEHPKSVYINSEQPKPVYANSKHPYPVSTNNEIPKAAYTNHKCLEPVYTNFERIKRADTSSEQSSQ